MEIIENLYIEKKPTIKQLYLKHAGEPISLDYFLFHTLKEANSLRELMDDRLLSERCPLVQGLQTFDLETVEVLVSWYRSNFQELSAAEVVDYEAFARMVKGLVLMMFDIEDLKNRSGRGFEEIKEIVLLLFKRDFPASASMMSDFFIWHSSDGPWKTLDINSIPPVGRYIPLMRQYVRKQNATARSLARSEPKKPRGEPSTTSVEDPIKVELAQKEVEEALVKMRSDGGLEQLALAPQNSFLRRLQHKCIVDAGFESVSEGEGNDRCVVVRRLAASQASFS